MSNSTTVSPAVKDIDFLKANAAVYGFGFSDLSRHIGKRDGKYFFFARECSGRAGGFVDYEALTKAIGGAIPVDDAIMGVSEWEQISGYDPDLFADYPAVVDELGEYAPGILALFIVSKHGADILMQAGEIVYYSYALNMYIWGVTHCGTSWEYVPTMIEFPEGLTD